MFNKTLIILPHITQARFWVWVRRELPCLFYALCFLSGNLAFSLFPLSREWIIAAVLIGTLLCCYKSQRLAAAIFVLGLFSALELQLAELIHSKKNATLLLKVEERPRYRLAGEVRFIAKAYILKSKYSGQSFSELKVENSKPLRLTCTGKDVPWENAAAIKKGHELIALADIKGLSLSQKPFSYAASQWRRKIQGSCKIRAVSHSHFEAASKIEKHRGLIISKLKKITGDNEASSLLLAMTLGVRDGISTRTERAFQQLGLTHILVVSGYHFGVIYGLLLSLGWLFKTTLPLSLTSLMCRKLALFFSLLLMFFYALLIGESVSSTRALMALFCLVGSLLFERGYSLINTIFVALVFLSILWPGTILDIGTQFTFAALFGIALALAVARYYSWPAWVCVAIFASMASQIIGIIWFGQISLWTLVSNLFIAPFAALIICNFGLVGLCLSLLNEQLAQIVLALPWSFALYLRDFSVWLCTLKWGYYEIQSAWRFFLVALIVVCGWHFFTNVLIAYMQKRRIFNYPAGVVLSPSKV